MNKKISLFLVAFMLAVFPVVGQERSDIERQLENIGLQNVAEEIPGIEVYMVYATPYNFMGRVLYEGLDEAYLIPADGLIKHKIRAAIAEIFGMRKM